MPSGMVAFLLRGELNFSGNLVLEIYINDLIVSKNKLTDFDDGLFYALVDKVKVNKDNIIIIWKNGTES